jgi:hypothetical protein
MEWTGLAQLQFPCDCRMGRAAIGDVLAISG